MNGMQRGIVARGLWISRLSLALFIAALAAQTACAAQGEWENLGIGGAGGIYTPACSPEDPNFMLACSDMSGCYRSVDGGRSWETIHWSYINSSRHCMPAFAPNNVVYWVRGPGDLVRSRDKAKTWKPVIAPLPWGRERVDVIAPVWATEGKTVLVGTDKALWQSKDEGKTWERVAQGTVSAIVALNGDVLAAVGKALLRSSDQGSSFQTVAVPQAGGTGFHGLAGGREAGKTVLLGLVKGKGILRSEDNGQTWSVTNSSRQFQQIAMPFQQTQIAYAAIESTKEQVWRTRDGGKTWENCFNLTWPRIHNGQCKNIEPAWIQMRMWGFKLGEKSLGVSPLDPKTVLVSSQCDCYISRDGGDTWKPCITNHKETPQGVRFYGNGFEVTSCWELYFDPNKKDKIYVAFTDIGFLQSDDHGKTWICGIKGDPWGNTTYSIAFDPFTKGRFYAACSNRHDIPHWTHVSPNNGRSHVGGVVEVSDYGAQGHPVSNGLPKLPCTDVVIDAKNSKKDALVMYAAMFGKGVYKTTDSGKSWTLKSNGLGGSVNRHVYDLGIQPVTGHIYCSITAYRQGMKFATPSGLWKSADGGETWQDISSSLKLRWAGGFALHPTEPDTIYLTAATAPGFAQCGLYKTTDGGKSWKHVLDQKTLATIGGQSYDHVFYVTLNPKNPDQVYVGTASHGLWFSNNAGESWKPVKAIPHKNCHRVTWDPDDENTIYVTTFGGGVWKGPAPK